MVGVICGGGLEVLVKQDVVGGSGGAGGKWRCGGGRGGAGGQCGPAQRNNPDRVGRGRR